MSRVGSSGAALLVVGVAAVALLALHPQPARASHLCGNTGSLFGPLDLQSYEAADWRTIYSQALELAGVNELFPEVPGFALPQLEKGPRSAGSDELGDPYIPQTLLKAIAWIESTWVQADWAVPYGEVGPVLVSHDCGYGIMQVTSGMQNISGVPNLDQAMIGGHYGFNIARGARILADKWNLAPEIRPLVGEREFALLEDWYYATWGYNGFAFKNHPLNPSYSAWPRVPYSCGPLDDGFGHDRSRYPYQELVFGCVTRPPLVDNTKLWSPQVAFLPDLSDPAFGEPLQLDNWSSCAQNLECAALDIPSFASPLNTTPAPTTPGPTLTPTPMSSPTPTPTPNPIPLLTPPPASTASTSQSNPTTASITRVEVIGLPSLNVSPGMVSLEASPDAESARLLLTVFNEGTGVLAWRATTSGPWLRLSRVQGVSLGADIGPRASIFSVWADASGLSGGTYTGAITFESLYASNVPLAVEVTLEVSGPAAPAAAPGDVDCDGEASAADALLVLRFMASLPPFADCISVGDVDCDGDIDARDALLILGSVAGLPLTLPPGCPAIGSLPT